MEDIHGLKPFILFAPNLRPLVLVALAAVAVALGIRWWLKRPRRLPPGLGAVRTVALTAKSARAQLDAIASRKLTHPDRAREFHVALSGIVRGYLQARFELPARRLTTTEALSALSTRSLDSHIFELVVEILPACDLSKFAGLQATTGEMESRLATARAIVDALGDLPVGAEDDDALPLGARP